MTIKADVELVEQCNELARRLYHVQGCEVPMGMLFYESEHRVELDCWRMAVEAYEHITGKSVSESMERLGLPKRNKG